MAKILISVVSHDNDDLIASNFSHIPSMVGAHSVEVLVVDNVGSSNLKDFCGSQNINYYCDHVRRGYGGNNNLNFSRASMSDDDVFIVCNPDVDIRVDQFEELIDTFLNSSAQIYGVKVYESQDLSTFSSHNRSFPCVFDPLISLVFKRKLFVGDVDEYSQPDWIGGAFMIFRAAAYARLGGFDERYFMYYEDTDLCHRAHRMGLTLIYDPRFFIVHEAQRRGRAIFSRHFLWNLSSMIRYFTRFPPRCIMGKSYNGR